MRAVVAIPVTIIDRHRAILPGRSALAGGGHLHRWDGPESVLMARRLRPLPATAGARETADCRMTIAAAGVARDTAASLT